VALLDALRVLTEFDPPTSLPPCDLAELADVLEAHGLAPLASYQLETRPLGAGLPEAFRERLLTLYQGIVNDNVFKILTLRQTLAQAPGIPVVLLDAAAYVDWLYPHLAFRPVGDLRVAVRASDGAAFAKAIGPDFRLESTGPGGHSARFSNEKITLEMQEGLLWNSSDEAGLFERGSPYRAFGPSAFRPGAEEAFIATVAEQARLGLHAPLYTFVDLRELVRAGLDRARLLSLAERTGLVRALFGSLALLSHFFPSVEPAASALRPDLGRAEAVAVEAVIDSARDPAQLRVLRGSESAARVILGT
jgi:hypothetical protein